MILKELKIKGFRSFCEEEVLKIEPDVTVLTGANDVGKTAVLHLVRMLYRSEKGEESDANYSARRRARLPLEQSLEYAIHATFAVGRNSRYLQNILAPDWTTELTYYPNIPEIRLKGVFDESGTNHMHLRTYKLRAMPSVIDLSYDEEIRTKISVGDLNPSEIRLMSAAFGQRFKEQLLEYSDEMFKSEVRGAVNNLNLKLRNALPDSLNLGFQIEVDRDEIGSMSFTIGVSDELTSDTPISLRGSGARKLLRLLAGLVDIDIESEDIIIVVDEPENSLHADAQHSLRHLLETLGRDPRMQVIYATHSSIMINASRPKGLRLLTRRLSENSNPTTKVNNKPYTGNNFQMIRTQLGISPADSLLYAPISVIIEGATESLGLNGLLRKLLYSGDQEYSDLEHQVGLLHFVVAGGSGNVSTCCKVVMSHGCKPIVLLDGDRKNMTNKVRRECPTVPIVQLEVGKEFEDIVQRFVYFKALSEFLKPKDKVSDTAFEKWCSASELPNRMMFSKRVEKWIESEFDSGLDKPQVMERAIELANLEDIDLSKIDELIDAIRNAAENLGR